MKVYRCRVWFTFCRNVYLGWFITLDIMTEIWFRSKTNPISISNLRHFGFVLSPILVGWERWLNKCGVVIILDFLLFLLNSITDWWLFIFCNVVTIKVWVTKRVRSTLWLFSHFKSLLFAIFFAIRLPLGIYALSPYYSVSPNRFGMLSIKDGFRA